MPFWQAWVAPQLPHEPPHASSPHCLPAHCLVQQPLLKHTSPFEHPQSAPQLAQFSPDWQTPLPHTSARKHLKLGLHTYPFAQPGGHWPPHVSSPHSLPEHCGVQHVPAAVHL
jgi:hypothetical protein